MLKLRYRFVIKSSGLKNRKTSRVGALATIRSIQSSSTKSAISSSISLNLKDMVLVMVSIEALYMLAWPGLMRKISKFDMIVYVQAIL